MDGPPANVDRTVVQVSWVGCNSNFPVLLGNSTPTTANTVATTWWCPRGPAPPVPAQKDRSGRFLRPCAESESIPQRRVGSHRRQREAAGGPNGASRGDHSGVGPGAGAEGGVRGWPAHRRAWHPYLSCRVLEAVGLRLRVAQGQRVWLACGRPWVMAEGDWPPGVPRRLDR